MSSRATVTTVRGVWPIAIFQSRYSGVYEGGLWFAVRSCYSVPEEAHGDDIDCLDWFIENKNKIGIGDTPNEAHDNLLFKIELERTVKRILEVGPRIGKSGYLGESPLKNL